MALGYDYTEVSDFLVGAGADQTVRNAEGHMAKNGLEGDKGPDGFVPPVEQLREARAEAETIEALRRIRDDPSSVDKAQLAQVSLCVCVCVCVCTCVRAHTPPSCF